MKKIISLFILLILTTACGKINLQDYSFDKYVSFSIQGNEKEAEVNGILNSNQIKIDYPELENIELNLNISSDNNFTEIRNGDYIDVEYIIECLDGCEPSSKTNITKIKIEGLKTLEQIEKEEKTRIAEEKKKKEIERKKELASYKTYSYNELARYPDKYSGKKVKLYGKVIQVIEGEEENQYRLALNDNYDQIVYLGIPIEKLSKKRILEDDYLTIRGISLGTITYESTMGGMITIPAVMVNYFNIK